MNENSFLVGHGGLVERQCSVFLCKIFLTKTSPAKTTINDPSRIMLRRDAGPGGPKPLIDLTICGADGSGQNTMLANLVYQLGGISEREFEKANEKYQSTGIEGVARKYKESRKRVVECDEDFCNEKEFYTEKYHCIVCDPIENQSFIKNYVAGAGDSDAALLVVPADTLGAAMEQASEHARLLWNLQVKQIAVAVNKMDAVGYKKESFDEAVGQIKDMMKKAGWPPKFIEEKLPFVPVSALKGENLMKPSGEMSWFSGQDVTNAKKESVKVHTLLDFFENFILPPFQDEAAPLRMLVEGVYKVKGLGDVLSGRVEQGVLKPGEAVMIAPTHVPKVNPCEASAFTIEMQHQPVEKALPGDIVSVNLKGLEHTNMPRAGDVLVHQKDTQLTGTKTFDANLYVLPLSDEIRVGTSLFVLMRCGRAAGKVSAIKWKIAPGEGRTENPESIERRGAACCTIELETALACDTRNVCEPTSRVAFMANDQPVMFGSIMFK